MNETIRERNETKERELEAELGALIDAYPDLTGAQILGILDRIKFDLFLSGPSDRIGGH
jgi:hypothetical protein